jgi:hypothetical protein
VPGRCMRSPSLPLSRNVGGGSIRSIWVRNGSTRSGAKAWWDTCHRQRREPSGGRAAIQIRKVSLPYRKVHILLQSASFWPDWGHPLTEEGLHLIVLGVILIILALLVPGLAILKTIGVILLVIGVVLAVLGGMGRAVGGRRH